ncbi:MAG TPA: AtpZ/AtpI family protein [Alphaproteobacteria bacterium]|jgi:ATP synthase protein I|nr:AtpZ/AtpI family protein [Alphaproteobacteria bacterium]
MTEPERPDNHLIEGVRERRKRRERGRREGERSIWENLSWMGVLGWLIVMPTLAGIFLGRWIDRGAGSGIFWTAALLFAGLCVGAYLAWKKVREG